MQLLGRRVGILVAAWLFAGCPRYSRQPPPNGGHSESSGATFASNANRATSRPVAVDTSKNPTCINGLIKTTGAAEIPVARARVKVARGESVVGETTTDDQGRFTWCAPRALDGMTVRTSVHVEKAAFVSSEREIDLPVGTTTELTIGLNPSP